MYVCVCMCIYIYIYIYILPVKLVAFDAVYIVYCGNWKLYTMLKSVVYWDIFNYPAEDRSEYTLWRRSTTERPLFSIVLKPACTFTWLQLIPLLTSSCCCYLTVWSLFYYTAIKSLVHIHCESYIDKIPVKKVVLWLCSVIFILYS